METEVKPRRQRVLQWMRKPFGWLAAGPRWFWRLLGRMGLALRHLLTWFIWKPFVFFTLPVWLPLAWFLELTSPLWKPILAFVGRVGLAERRLLALIIWQPLVWTGQRLRWLGQLLVGRLLALWQKWWLATAPRRALLRRRWYSYWRVRSARWRVRLRRPKPPATAVRAPTVLVAGRRQKRLTRLALGVAAVTMVLAAIVIWNNNNRDMPVAAAAIVAATPQTQIIVVTPTPGPATPTPRPTLDVKLTPWATPDPLVTGGTLAFSWRRSGNSDIYLLPFGQTEPVRLTSQPDADEAPAWSPGGQELAFASRRGGNWDIYVYNLAERTLRRVTTQPEYDGRPSWSPDGQWLVYESYQRENLDIYIVRADGSEGPFRLTENSALDFDPVWAPGGRHIAFVSWRSGNKDLFVLSLNEVTDEAAVNLTQTPADQEDAPAFSPDGRFLAYHDTSGAFPLLYTLPLSEEYTPAGPTQLVGQQGEAPAWAPNGRSLITVFQQAEQSFLMGAALEGWGVAPQTFVADAPLSHPSWTALELSPDAAARLDDIDQTAGTAVLFKESLFAPQAEGAPVLLQPLTINAPSPYLNDRVDESFTALRERLLVEAGWDVLAQLDQMFAPLEARPLPGQPAQSWHQAARAFDLPYREVLAFEPQIEVVREDVGTQTYWRVYVKTAVQDGSQGQPLRVRPWDFRARFEGDAQYFDQGGRVKDSIPPGYYVDLTALAADYGWQRVPATTNWRTYFPGIRFWQFENRQGLTWEEAMLELYTIDELGDRLDP